MVNQKVNFSLKRFLFALLGCLTKFSFNGVGLGLGRFFHCIPGSYDVVRERNFRRVPQEISLHWGTHSESRVPVTKSFFFGI